MGALGLGAGVGTYAINKEPKFVESLEKKGLGGLVNIAGIFVTVAGRDGSKNKAMIAKPVEKGLAAEEDRVIVRARSSLHLLKKNLKNLSLKMKIRQRMMALE